MTERDSAIDTRAPLPRFTNEFSDTYRAADGEYVTRTFSQPVNFKGADGSWQPIDSTLSPVGDGSGAFQNHANSWHVHLPSSLGSGNEVSLQSAGKSVGFSLEGAGGSAAVTSGSEAQYRDVFQSTDVDYVAGPSFVKEKIVLSSASAPNSYTFPLDLPQGWVAKVVSGGGVVFLDASGKSTGFSVAPATVRDSSGVFSTPFAPVTLKVVAGDAGGSSLVVTVARSWLDDSARVFPVTIDPTLELGGGGTGQTDCWIYQAAPDSSGCGDGYMSLGEDSGGQAARILLSFLDLSVPADAEVTQATLGVDFSPGAGLSGVTAYSLTSPWNSAATWNSSGYGQWDSPGGDFDPGSVIDSETVSGAGGFTSWYVTSMVQNWVDGSQDNDGVLLQADSAGALDGAYNTATGSGPSTWPYLQIDWTPRFGEPAASPIVDVSTGASAHIGVNAANGDMHLDLPAMSIAGTGIALNLGLSYDSIVQKFGYQGMNAGAGFVFNMPMLFFAYSGSASGAQVTPWVVGPDGEPASFAPASTNATNGSTIYWAPGIDATLIYNVTNGNPYWVEKLNSDGEMYIFQANASASDYGALIYDETRDGQYITYNWGTNGSGNAYLQSITDTQGRTITPSYDSAGMVTAFTDPTGRSVRLAYTTNDPQGVEELSSITDPDGNTTNFSYTSGYLLGGITDPDGNQTAISYSTNGFVREVTAGSGAASYQFAYGGGNGCPGTVEPTLYTDPDGHQTTFCSDRRDDVVKSTDPLGISSTTSYNKDAAATTSSVLDQYSNTQQVVHAAYNKVDGLDTSDPTYSSVSDPTGFSLAGGSASYADAANPYQPTSTTDPQGNSTSYSYDAYGDLTKEIDALYPYSNPLQSSISMSYAFGNYPGILMTSSTDPDGNVTQYQYDSQGNLSQISYPGAPLGPKTYTYDALGRVQTYTDGDGNVTSYSYDADGRMTEENFTAAGGSTTIVYFNYDRDGDLISEVDPSGIQSNTYNSLGQLTETDYPNGATAYYANTASGLLTELDYYDNEGYGATTQYRYDADGQVTSLTDATGATTTFTYNALGQRTQARFSNGLTINYTYNSAGQELGFIATNSTGAIDESESYNYNDGSTNTDLLQTATDHNGNTWTYSYDPLNRLVNATERGQAVNNYYPYSYDGDGNLEYSDPILSAFTQVGNTHNYQYNAANEQIADNSTPETYDADGNLLSNPSDGADKTCAVCLANPQAASSGSFTYNDRDQTSSIDGVGLTFFGTGQNHQTSLGSETIDNSQLGPEEIYLREADQATPLHSVGPKQQYPSVTESADAGPRFFIDLPDGTSIGEIATTATVAAGNSDTGPVGPHLPTRSTPYYFITDPHNSVLGVTGTDGLLLRQNTYDPYGNLTSSTSYDRRSPGTGPDDIGYDASLTSLGLPIDHFGARLYQPGDGRWTQPDPAASGLATDPTQTNAYQFAGDDPVNNVDPSGNGICGLNSNYGAVPGGCYAGANPNLWSAGLKALARYERETEGPSWLDYLCDGPGSASLLKRGLKAFTRQAISTGEKLATRALEVVAAGPVGDGCAAYGLLNQFLGG